jgi:beta-1,4-mannosyl-glycoprotein beta-1,4-N-acetylglucosaminyltransferase
MKIYDCFLFFNELDLLELRLNVLDECVDYFVIVESAITFQGEDKEYLFEKNRSRFAKFEHKIIHYKVEKYSLDFANLPYISEPRSVDDTILNAIYKHIDACPHFDKQKEFWWGNDFFQRECIWRALATAEPQYNDLILLSDVDEIPNPAALLAVKKHISPDSIVCFRQHEFCYFLNYYHNSNWVGTCGILYSSPASISFNAIRVSAKLPQGCCPQMVDNGGWHFTSVGSIASIKEKIGSWGHREFNTRFILKKVDYNVRHGYDIFRRPGFGRLQYLPIQNSMLPPYLACNAQSFAHLVGPELEQEWIFLRLFGNAYIFIFYKIKGALKRTKAFFTI